jgi:SAM-dependent methyltransferase
VLCQTLLHPAIRSAHFLRFAASAIGDELAADFDHRLEFECRRHFTPQAWLHLWDTYTGNWEHEVVADQDNEIFGSLGAWLNAERRRTHTPAKTWKQFAKPDAGNGTLELLKRVVRHPSKLPLEQLDRVLDLGCGDGLDLAAVAHGLGLSRTDALCLDVGAPRLDAEAEGDVTFLTLDSSSPEAYAESLASHLADGLAGTVAIAYSFVTFHHIAKPGMRASALRFLRDALVPGGIFLIAEWDNPGSPLDFSVYFDLVHDLPALFFQQPAATEWTLRPHGTRYTSRTALIAEAESFGLQYDNHRSEMPSRGSNGVVWRDSQWMADHSVNRNYMAVFGVGPRSASFLPFRPNSHGPLLEHTPRVHGAEPGAGEEISVQYW